jgi:hypothetical protein
MRSTTSLASSAELKASIRSTFPVIVAIIETPAFAVMVIYYLSLSRKIIKYVLDLLNDRLE